MATARTSLGVDAVIGEHCDRCHGSYHSRVLVTNPIEYENDTTDYYGMRRRAGYTGKLWLCVPCFEEGFLGQIVTSRIRTDKNYEDFWTYFKRVARSDIAKGDCAGCPDGGLDRPDLRT